MKIAFPCLPLTKLSVLDLSKHFRWDILIIFLVCSLARAIVSSVFSTVSRTEIYLSVLEEVLGRPEQQRLHRVSNLISDICKPADDNLRDRLTGGESNHDPDNHFLLLTASLQLLTRLTLSYSGRRYVRFCKSHHNLCSNSRNF